MQELLKNKIDKKYDGIPFCYVDLSRRSMYVRKRKKWIGEKQEFHDDFFTNRLFANFPFATRFAQTANQVCCEFVKKSMEF